MKKLTAVAALAALAALLWLPGRVFTQSATIAPSPFLVELDNSGRIVNGGCIWTYTAGTTTAAATYLDNLLAGTNTNPIRSDSAGRFTAFLIPGQSYKFVYESSCVPPAHGTVYRTADNILAVSTSVATFDVTGTAGETLSAGACAYMSDGSGGKIAGQWYLCDSANSYSSTMPNIGLVPNAISGNTSGTIRMGGLVTGLTGLTTGSFYYVSTAGTLAAGTRIPNLNRLVGIAASTTSIIVSANPPGLAQGYLQVANVLQIKSGGNLTFNDAGSMVLTAGTASPLGVYVASPASLFLRTDGTAGTTIYTKAIGSGTSGWIPVVTSNSTTGYTQAQAYSSGDYTATNGTFTVDSGDVTANNYRVVGDTLYWTLRLTSATTATTPDTLVIKIPGSFTAAETGRIFMYVFDGATQLSALDITSGQTTVSISLVAGGSYTDAANTAQVSFQLMMKVS